MMAQLCVMFANTLALKLYHYVNGTYYYVGDGRAIPSDTSAIKEQKNIQSELEVKDLKEDGSPGDGTVVLEHLQADLSPAERQTSKATLEQVWEDNEH